MPQETTPSTLVDTILSEGPLGMSAVARRLGTFRDGKATHPSTPTRWATRGVTLPDGRKLRLEAVRLNGRLVTSWDAVIRFISAQQRAGPDTPAAPPRSPADRQRASEAAARELEQLGI